MNKKKINLSSMKVILLFLLILYPAIGVIAINTDAQPVKRLYCERVRNEIIKIEEQRVVSLADSFLLEKPITVTASFCIRSAGGIHDYYSEATYWWPNSENPDGAYIRRDGLNNPENFDDHLKAIGRFSWIVGTETSAYLLTGKEKYAVQAMKHLQAWFVDSTTLMHPHLLYAQAIKGVNTGRGIGIIDAISLIEVVKSIEVLQKSPYLSNYDFIVMKQWFRDFLNWLNTHQYGIDEMNAKNNHGTWWHAQVAAYAKLIDDSISLKKCKNFYLDQLLRKQMSYDGSFPLEIERTKPFAYSLFNLDGAATLAWLTGSWNNKLPDGRSMNIALEFIKPFVIDKNSWRFPKDVLRWDEQPGRRPFMFFAAMNLNDFEWIKIWKDCDAGFPSDESKRNMPLKNPILWIGISEPIK